MYLIITITHSAVPIILKCLKRSLSLNNKQFSPLQRKIIAINIQILQIVQYRGEASKYLKEI